MIRHNDKRDVVAVLIDAFAPFHRDVLDHLQRDFARVGFGTLGVVGRDVSSDRFRDRLAIDPEQIRSLGARFNIRGAVIISGAIPPGIDEPDVLDFVAGLTDGPTVSFGSAVPGLPSIVIRWEETITELVDHMLVDPRRQRFVFVRGHSGDTHSVEREAGFRRGMAAAGLEVDERLVVSGHYSEADSLHAVSALIEQGLRFDGIIAANDDMAVGAIAALTRHGLSVPDDVIVSGFDDSLASFESVPPLTTALLDTPRLSAATARLVIDAVSDGRVLAPDLRVEIDSRLVVRESSRPEIVERHRDRRPLGSDPRIELKQRLLDRWDMSRTTTTVDTDTLAETIVSTVIDGCDSFSVLAAAATGPGRNLDRAAMATLRHVQRVVRSVLVECDPDELSVRGLQIIVEQIEVIDRRLRPIETTSITEAASRRNFQQRLTINLAESADSRAMWPALRAGLSELGLRQAWVAVNDPDTPGVARVVFALDDDDIDDIGAFSSADLLPDRWVHALEHHLNVMIPLRAGTQHIGYMIADPAEVDLIGLVSIASEIAQVLRHTEQMTALERRAAELHAANEALDDLARIDSLTGLGNRTALFEGLADELADPRGGESELAVLFFDLDGFKAINDTMGHTAGDEMLQLITSRIATLLDPDDLFARLGGDEFTIVLRQDVGSGRALEVAEAIRADVERPCLLAGGEAHVTASIGIACAPGDGVDAGDLVSRADTAMYDAKTSGKNAVVRYRRDVHLSSVDPSSEHSG